MRKLALITGAKGGIGNAITHKFIEQGYRVIAIHSPSSETEAKAWVKAQGFSKEQLVLYPLNVTEQESCRTQLKQIVSQEGTPDILVNNAGITRDSQFKKMSAAAWNQVIDINLNSLFNVTQPLFEAMCEKGNARIINISSVNGIKGQFGQTNYAATKSAMIGFSKSLAMEGARYGVTVNVVAPGYTATPMVSAMRAEVLESIKAQVPLKRLAEPKEVAAAVAYLASDDASYITGETLSINGGLHMQ